MHAIQPQHWPLSRTTSQVVWRKRVRTLQMTRSRSDRYTPISQFHNTTASHEGCRLHIDSHCSTRKRLLECARTLRGLRAKPLFFRCISSCGDVAVTCWQEMKCMNCKSPLDMPSVHFLCGHSYHQRCLVGDTEECTFCSEDRRKVLDIVRAQSQSAEDHGQVQYLIFHYFSHPFAVF